MAGSEADKQPDEGAESPARVERPSLADFLKPPLRSKSSMPPPPETTAAADVPPPSSTKNLGDLFSEAPVPRSRRRSSLIPHPPSGPGAPPVDADEHRDADEDRHVDEDRDADDDDTDEDREADEDDADEDRDADDNDDNEPDESSIADDVDGADAALSVPPPLLSRNVARRAAIAVGALLVAIALWAGVRKFQTRPGAAPVSSVSVPVPSAEVPLPLVPTNDLDPDPDDLDEEPPVDEAKGLALRREARAMLEAGRIDEGVATARSAIEANPGDPETYILLAAGLQDQGKWEEARQIFTKCVRQSTRAERSECVYFATRGK